MSKKNKQTQMSIQMLKPEVDAYKEFVTLDVYPQGYTEPIIVKLFPLFSPENVAKLVSEFLELLGLCEKEKVTVLQEDEGDLLGYLIVKYFTDIKVTKSKKSKMIIDEVNLLKNSQLYKEIMELFPKESTASVHERLMDVNEAFSGLEDKLKGIQKEYENLNLENKAEIESAFKNKKVKNDEHSARNVLADKGDNIVN